MAREYRKKPTSHEFFNRLFSAFSVLDERLTTQVLLSTHTLRGNSDGKRFLATEIFLGGCCLS